MMKVRNLDQLYEKSKTSTSDFDSLKAPPLHYFISQYDIDLIRSTILNPKNKRVSKKINLINQILNPRGFIQMAAGTNRIVYRHTYNNSIVIKVAIDQVGMRDSPAEMINQEYLKPFVSKVFDVSRCGTVGLFERVVPIKNREEFLSVADDIFELLSYKILGKYVLEDIGTEFFKNFGMRPKFGPVLLDYPYLYELDPTKLHCSHINDDGSVCDGLIDYDDGFNILVCEKCGLRYTAKSLSKKEGLSAIDNTNPFIKKEEGKMYKYEVNIVTNDGDIVESNIVDETVAIDSTNSVKEPVAKVEVIEFNKPNYKSSHRLNIRKKEPIYKYNVQVVSESGEREGIYENLRQDKREKRDKKETILPNKLVSFIKDFCKVEKIKYDEFLDRYKEVVIKEYIESTAQEDDYEEEFIGVSKEEILDDKSIIEEFKELEEEEKAVEEPSNKVIDDIIKENNQKVNVPHKALMSERDSINKLIEGTVKEYLSRETTDPNDTDSIFRFVKRNIGSAFPKVTNIDSIIKSWMDKEELNDKLTSDGDE